LCFEWVEQNFGKTNNTVNIFEKRKMRGIRKIWFFGFLLVAILFTQDARAIPVGGVLDANHTETFAIGTGSATVDCKVYSYTSGEYVYTYQISNIDSDIGLSFFSVGILDGADTFDADFEPLLGVVNPDLWAVVGSPAQSVDGLFSSPIYSDGPITTSTVLWFVSDDPPILGNGTLFGTASGTAHYASGDILTPIPEPATFVLFGIGVLLTLPWKRRFA